VDTTLDYFIPLGGLSMSGTGLAYAPHPLADLLHYFGEGGGYDRGEGIPKFKRLSSDGDDDGGRAATIQLLGARKQPGGRASVGKR
jgi:hypothetical protein